ncbi:MAG: dihydroneopterin aldolase [Melioribacteraceae bacterium]|nr:dihydroneopterin aldolase [Melioribacteraceae bacterium]MCF8265952.1 dihydroneopterin aldolase [Melioribacteraceae bacterium]MCF8413470.1 dihydroneopterin aldolase [Melioribacteraceae bacterium]MCF8432736.1 dihydroneopterin aldolase [Melioribacteraceae bacterium]
MLNIIRIKNASFYAYHGALSEEQSIGGRFEADVDMYTDFSEAAKNDDLNLTINYDKVYKYINKIVHQQKYYLIETIATIIADGLLDAFPQITKVSIRVRKNNVPVGGVIDCVEVEVSKERDE